MTYHICDHEYNVLRTGGARCIHCDEYKDYTEWREIECDKSESRLLKLMEAVETYIESYYEFINCSPEDVESKKNELKLARIEMEATWDEINTEIKR